MKRPRLNITDKLVDEQGRATPAFLSVLNAVKVQNSDVTGLGTAALKDIGTSGSTVPLLDGNNTWSGTNHFTAKVTTATPSTGAAGLNLPHGTAPTSPVNGDLWTTSTALLARMNGTTRTLAFIDGALGTPTSGTLTNCTGLPISGLTPSTSASLGVGTIDLGHASDTTLSRASAGDINVEGNIVYRAGGTDVPITDGGTGASTASGARSNLGLGAAALLATDTDGTLAANSDSLLATQKAVKTYIDTAVTGLLEFKGSTNCSANPNYPAAQKGDAYVVSVAGKIGGASGKSVDIGDVYLAIADNAGGTEASVGTSWNVLEHNLVGALLSANNLSDLASASTARTNLGLGAGDSPQFTAVNMGHASDTTISRVSAGDLSVEGNLIYRAGGTDIPVTDGGTGRSTGTTAYALIATGTTATGAQQTLAAGATTEILVGGGASALPVWTAATGTGAPVRAGSPIITGTATIANISISASGNVSSASDSRNLINLFNGSGQTEFNTVGGYIWKDHTSTTLATLSTAGAFNLTGIAEFAGTDSGTAFSGHVLALRSRNTAAAGVGPTLSFNGATGNAVTPYTFGFIRGSKVSGSGDGDYKGQLSFQTSDAAGALAERFNVSSTGITASKMVTINVGATNQGIDLATYDAYLSGRVIRNNATGSDGLYLGWGNSNSGVTRLFGGGSTTAQIVLDGSTIAMAATTLNAGASVAVNQSITYATPTGGGTAALNWAISGDTISVGRSGPSYSNGALPWIGGNRTFFYAPGGIRIGNAASSISYTELNGGRITTGEDVKALGQGRFVGWRGSAATDFDGAAMEIGQTGGTCYLIGYDRTNVIYKPVRIDGAGITLTYQGTAVQAIASTGTTFTGGLRHVSSAEIARFEGIATQAPTGAAGLGVEVGTYNSQGVVSAINRSTGVAAPIVASGSAFQFTLDGFTNIYDVGFRDLPPNAQSGNYTLALTDRAKHIYYTGSGHTLTIPANSTVAFPVGTAITVINNGSGNFTLSRAGSVSMKMAGVNTDANRTLAVAGMCTLVKVATDAWFVSGSGLS